MFLLKWVSPVPFSRQNPWFRKSAVNDMVTGEPVKLLSVLFGATVSEMVIFCTVL